MTPRPIHRWKSFWLGILILLCLGGAWWRSHAYTDQAGFSLDSGSRSIILAQGNGSIALISHHDPTYHNAIPFASSRMNDQLRSWFPPAFSANNNSSFGLMYLSFAHWFLILLFLIPWLALLIWRWQRIKCFTHIAEAGRQ